jgi:alpha-tubulin suppressor-like RCC1 family protein
MKSQIVLLALVAMFAGCNSPEAPKDPPLTLDDTPGGWKMIAAGDGQSCGIAKTSLVYCWGKNDRGQLGDGTQLPHSTPARVLSDSAFSMVTAGTLSSCGVTGSGVAYCWGFVADSFQSTPLLMDPQRRFTMLAAGVWMICGLTTGGSVYCWSLTVTDAPDALPLPGGVHFQALVTSNNFFCGISTDEKVYCWEADTYGRPIAPELRSTLPAAAKIAAGDQGYYTPGSTHICTIDHRGATYCWGTNTDGQLGLGDHNPRDAPMLLVNHLFAEISASGGRTCGVAVNGVPYCWGSQIVAEGNARDSAQALLPGVRAATPSVGPDHYCFLTAGGAAFCGGENGAGQLGTGTSGEVGQPLRPVLNPA